MHNLSERFRNLQGSINLHVTRNDCEVLSTFRAYALILNNQRYDLETFVVVVKNYSTRDLWPLIITPVAIQAHGAKCLVSNSL